MKRLAIGDTHGRDNWKQFINQDFDEFYFLGDYVDDYEQTSAIRQINNFKEIVQFARNDNYGDSPHDGPLWVRPRSLLLDKLDGYQQIVGHTHQKQINTIDGVTFIDIESRDVYRF